MKYTMILAAPAAVGDGALLVEIEYSYFVWLVVNCVCTCVRVYVCMCFLVCSLGSVGFHIYTALSSVEVRRTLSIKLQDVFMLSEDFFSPSRSITQHQISMSLSY